MDFGDISLKELAGLGSLKIYFQTKPHQIASRARRADLVITNKCVFHAGIFPKLKRLRCIAVTATGVNNIDLEAAAKRGIAVTHVSGYSTESVLQSTFAFLLALAGNLIKFNQAAHSGAWSRSPFFVLGSYPVTEIHGKTLGIVGYGAIGRRVAQAAKAFGMKVLVARIPGRSYRDRIQRCSLGQAVKQADFLTLHAPLTPLTRNLIDGRILRKMKKTACVINMARGGIVDEKALRQVLDSGRIAGAAADVLSQEPPPRNHILLGAPNFLLTPHVAWASRESRRRVAHETYLNLRAFLKGRKRNRVA